MTLKDPTQTGLYTQVDIDRPIDQVWQHFTDPQSITQWNSASPDWHTPRAENDLKPGGAFNYRMESRDGSMGFDFSGVFDDIQPQRQIDYTIGDGRAVRVSFERNDAGGTRVQQWFEPESQNSPEMQQQGWQAILDSFRAWVESR